MLHGKGSKTAPRSELGAPAVAPPRHSERRSKAEEGSNQFSATRCVKNLMSRDPTSFHRFTGLQHAAVAKIV